VCAVKVKRNLLPHLRRKGKHSEQEVEKAKTKENPEGSQEGKSKVDTSIDKSL
jgi:hypothetical protein